MGFAEGFKGKKDLQLSLGAPKRRCATGGGIEEARVLVNVGDSARGCPWTPLVKDLVQLLRALGVATGSCQPPQGFPLLHRAALPEVMLLSRAESSVFDLSVS